MTQLPTAGHVVVLGASRVARALAGQQARHGIVVQAGGEPALAFEGAEIVDVPLSPDPEVLVRTSAAAKARLVALDLQDDVTTIATLAELVAATASGHRPEIVVNVRDAALRRVIDENLRAADILPRPRLVSTSAITAAAAVAAARPCDLAHWRGQERIHAVVIGFTALGRDCVEELILAGIVGEFRKPRVTILDRDPLAVRTMLDRETPEIDLSADIALHPLDMMTLAAADGPLARAEAVAPITLVVITLTDPKQAIDAMTAIARMQERDGQAVAASLLVTEGQTTLFAMAKPSGRARDLGRSWAIAGGIEHDPDILDLLTRRSDALAERLHDAYCRTFPGGGPGNLPWARLAESFRKANRRAAAHLPLKLWTLGLIERGASPDPFAVDPHTFENVITPCATGTAEDALLRRLSRIEHDRWMAERRLDGWRFGDVRDDVRRIHPKLIPFDDARLTDLDIEKDADQVRTLFATVVAPAPDGAVTPLVLGVIAAAEAVQGIDVAAALDLCRREPWRPIVVLSGVLNGQECGALRVLDEQLAGLGRDWRLVVPEISRDNRELRVIGTPDDKALLDAFLQRPSTRFAPIAGVIAAVDLWADPSVPDPHLEAVAAYIAARCSAILDAALPHTEAPLSVQPAPG